MESFIKFLRQLSRVFRGKCVYCGGELRYWSATKAHCTSCGMRN